MVGLVETDSSDFKWGNLKCLGVNKNYKFYCTFTLDGVDYELYDAVYMFDEREDDPHIGLIIKIWETPSGIKKVKVLWFFRPREIRNFIEEDVSENELFLATGEGIGLTNTNPLEAISGKCDVVWIKEDSRENFRSGVETRNDGYFVYRTFDVDRRIVSDKVGDVIAGVEASVLLGRISNQESQPMHNLKEKSTEGVDQSGLQEKNAILCKISDALEEKDDQNLCEKTADHVANKLSLPESSQLCHTIGGLKISESGASRESESVLIANSNEVNEKEKGDLASNGLTRKRTENMKPNKSHLKKQKLDKSINVEVVNVSQSAMKNPASDSSYNPSVENDAENKTTETICTLNVFPNEVHDDPLPKPSLEKDSSQDIDVLKKSEKQKIDKSKWFKLPWDDKLKMYNEQGKLVLLCNFDSSFSGSEVEEIIRKAFNLRCSARIIPQTTCSSPNFGQAFAMFLSKKAAETVVTKLTEDCLLLSTGRPLVAKFVSPCFPSTEELLCGHFVHDKAKYKLQKDMKYGGSTCHFSQPNTIEFEMAREWYLLDERSNIEWKSLFKYQSNDLRNFKAL